MARRLFYRNIQAGEQLELFLVSAVASLLLVRFFLSLTGFPQLGGGGLHIAHMLWGGVLMLAAMVIMLSFLGMRAQRIAALTGGAGFGIFIDEIGKFITSDNNYFFRPAVGIIYAIFVALYLMFNFMTRREQQLSSREYQLNALKHLEEAILADLDPYEKQQAQQLLRKADQHSAVTRQLQMFLESVDTVKPDEPSLLAQIIHRADRLYKQYWYRRKTVRLVRLFFVLEAALVLVSVFLAVYNNIDEVVDVFTGRATYGRFLLVGEAISATIAMGFVTLGAVRLPQGRRVAFEQFRRATLINLLLTYFFVFSRVQFAALPGFLVNLVILLLISYVVRQERGAGSADTD